MIEIPKHLIIALEEIGEAEIAGEDFNTRIAEYLETVDMIANDEIPWCAAFVNWCLNKAEIFGTALPNAKSYLEWGYNITQPVVGAITVFDRGKHSWQGHVGFFLDQSDNYVYIIGGNQSNRVSIRPYNKNKLVGYRWSPKLP